MPTYGQLNQRHPSSNEQRRTELEALYEGGEKLERLYPTLLPRRDRERERRYQTRLKEAQYRNYFGPIIDYFKSMLFVSRPVIKAKLDDAKEATSDAGEYWTKLREDCDRGGTDIDDLFGSVLIDAMVGRTGWIRLHSPSDGGPAPADALEFEARGLGDAWLERVEPCRVLDWDLGSDGRLDWVVVHRREQRRAGLAGDRKTVVETWEFLTRETVETYQLSWQEGQAPKPDQEVPRIGDVAAHRFGVVPLVCLDLPPALWVGSRLRSAQLAHFRKLNAQAWSLATSCYAMRQYFVANPEEFSKVVSGPGYEIVLGKDDKAEWDAPPAQHFAALDTEIKAEKDEIFRVAHQMALGVENNAAAVGRSAESKASDAESTRVVLVAFSRRVKECIEFVFDAIARQRGEKFEWSVEGLDDFAAFDIKSFLEQLELVGKSGGIPSRTFEIQSKTRVAEALLKDVDEQTKATIRKEIEAGAADPVEQRERELQAAESVFGNARGVERARKDPANGESGAARDSRRPAPRQKQSRGEA